MISADLQKDTTALDKNEIDEAEIIIAKMHQMREHFLWDVFPMFACCLKKCKCLNQVNKRTMDLLEKETKD